jgi:adenine phosphoribosyltransferase
MMHQMREHARDALETRLRATIRDVPDFPKPGILFKDITPVLSDPELFSQVTNALTAPYGSAGVTHVAAVEARGFILGAPVALALGVAFVPVRKAGKLPARAVREEYVLEYGTDALEVHDDVFSAGARVLVIDDVLATGGTAAAACRLIERAGGTIVGLSFLMELICLTGRDALGSRRVDAVLKY